MNLYVDSSVVLRIVLGEDGSLAQWSRIRRACSSELVRLECLRTIDRARLRRAIPDSEIATRRAAVLEVLTGFEFIPIDEEILRRASDAFPTSLGSLDAIHLASALRVQGEVPDLALATHDVELATAARALGLRVFGVTVR
ncbi:MAG: type II toxin-antitoxin system VapC family toxin [Deltaproteobacteria bacterium]|nr:type II toxin-antitoxin system VapC family toxin [Deltaproteobacteria bacterium]